MKAFFWMLVVMLTVLTLLSALGGGIRYRENFFEEVFELQDINAELNKELVDPVPPEVIEPPKPTPPVKACKPPKPVPQNQPTPPPAPKKAQEPLVSGYSGPSYASV